MASLGRYRALLVNAASLIATTGLTSALGFAYWNIAARLFSQQAVGYGAGAVSVMTLLSSFGVFGLSTLLIGSLPGRTGNRSGLIWAAALAAGAGSLVLSIGFVFVAPYITTHFNPIIGTPLHAALLCAGVVLTTVSAVFDAAAIGLLRGGLQLTRNLAFVVVKLLTLIGVATVLHYTLGIGLFFSWVAAIPVSLLVVAAQLGLQHQPFLRRPEWGVLKSFGSTVAAHNWLNLAISAPGLLVPVLAASILAPSVNAGFYAAWTICSFLYVLPGHISTALFAVASGDTDGMARQLRLSLRISILLGIPGMALLGFGARYILHIFGPGYAGVGTVPMQLLVLTYLPAVPGSFYVAVCRAVGKLTRAANVLTAFAVVNVVASVIGCLRGGLVGMTFAGLVVTLAEALYTTPAVARAAAGYGRHRRGAGQTSSVAADAAVAADTVAAGDLVAAANAPTMWFPIIARGDGSGMWGQQKEGLAVLLAMSSPAPPNQIGLAWPNVVNTQPIPIIRREHVTAQAKGQIEDPSGSRAPGRRDRQAGQAEDVPTFRAPGPRDRQAGQAEEPSPDHQGQDRRDEPQSGPSDRTESLPRR